MAGKPDPKQGLRTSEVDGKQRTENEELELHCICREVDDGSVSMVCCDKVISTPNRIHGDLTFWNRYLLTLYKIL